MKKFTVIMAALAVALFTGCSTAFVNNKAAYEKKTLTDGTVLETRTAENKGKAFGADAVKQSVTRMMADVTQDDHAASIGAVEQQSESRAAWEFAGRVADKGLSLLGAYFNMKAGGDQGLKVSGSQGDTAETMKPSNPETLSPGSVAYSGEGYGGAAAQGGVGVYGKPGCSRCAAYLASHPGVELINIEDPANAKTMFAALRALGYTGTSAALPVVISADGYALGAR